MSLYVVDVHGELEGDYEIIKKYEEPRKGHWILRDVEGVGRVWFCKCSECGKDPQDYIAGTENWWLTKSNLPNYCPHCGSDNRGAESEVKE